MSMQDRHACAVLSDGSVACAGATVGLVESDTPEIVSGMSNAREVVVTQDSACALRANGTVWCWGPGIGSPTPTQIVGAVDARSISAGYRHVCVLEGASGDAKCFGHNGQLQLGYVGTSSGAFVDIGLSGMLAVTAAGNATCVLRTTGVVSCFGYGGSNQLGNGMTVDSATPVDVIGVTTAIGLAASSFNSGMCALLGDGTMQCWGTGLPTTAVSIPGERIQRVANSCVATDAGRIWCFRSAPWSTPVLLIDGGATVMAPVPLGDAGCFGGTSGLICTGPRADSGRFGVVPVRRFLSPTRVASPP